MMEPPISDQTGRRALWAVCGLLVSGLVVGFVLLPGTDGGDFDPWSSICRAVGLGGPRGTAGPVVSGPAASNLRGQGYSGQAIARYLGISRSTVFRHLRSETFPERKGRGDAGRSLLDPWQHTVLEHWNIGRRHGRRMFRMLRKDGYRGSYPTLARYLQRLRAAQGIVLARKPAKQPRPVLVAAPRRVLTPRTAAWLVLRRAEKRSPDDHALLAGLRQHAPELDEAIALAEEFTGLIRDHAPDRLDTWLQRAGNSIVRQLQGFAKRLQADYKAVRAGVALAWSNGQTEGQVNRLKTLKRQMYGRANLDLLGRRFLLAA